MKWIALALSLVVVVSIFGDTPPPSAAVAEPVAKKSAFPIDKHVGVTIDVPVTAEIADQAGVQEKDLVPQHRSADGFFYRQLASGQWQKFVNVPTWVSSSMPPAVSLKQATGHWEYRTECGPTGCKRVRVWVPDVSQSTAKDDGPSEMRYAAYGTDCECPSCNCTNGQCGSPGCGSGGGGSRRSRRR